MNIESAKSISINDFLQQAGHAVVKITAKDHQYLSPFRNEKTPSFHVTKDGRGFKDFGDGRGGNIIDLAYRMVSGLPLPARLDGEQVKEALAFIEKVVGTIRTTGYNIPIIRQSLPMTPAQPAYTVEATRTMIDRRGENWCRSRGLDVDACRPWLSDIYFNRAEKPTLKGFYGIGLRNIADGFEMRTQLTGGPWVKSSIGHKTITVFPADDENARWYLFEGLPDFCTFLTHRRPAVNELNFLILNGTGLTGHAIDYLKDQPPGYLTLCPQHGSQGSLQSCETLRDFAGNNGWYGGEIDYPKDSYDYNAWHMKKKGLQPVGAKSAAQPALKNTPKI